MRQQRALGHVELSIEKIDRLKANLKIREQALNTVGVKYEPSDVTLYSVHMKNKHQ